MARKTTDAATEAATATGAIPNAPETAATVTVAAPRDGYRRAGRAWTREPVTLPAEEVDEEMLAALRADPAMTVT